MKVKDKVFTKEASIFTRSFLWAGISFAIICLVGVMTWAITDRGGVLKGLNELSKYDWAQYTKLSHSSQAATLYKISIGSMILILASGVMRIIWMFRFDTVSKNFIYINYGIYIISQGLGFGILFTIWRAQEIMTIFGIAGGAFLTMAWAGYIAKDLSKMRPYLIMGSIFLMITGFIMMFMSLSGAISDNMLFVWTLGMGALTLAFTAFDVWSLKKTSQFFEAVSGDEMTEFRIVAWFGFRLLTDLVQLVWVAARIYLRMNR